MSQLNSRRPPSAAPLFVVFFALLLIGGCASGPTPGPATPAAGKGRWKLGTGSAQGQVAPWQVAPGDLGTQRLFRVHYEGPEGKVGLKMTLYLQSTEHFRLDAADSLGRRVWSLSVEPGDRAVWLNHRQKEYCRVYSHRRQTFLPIAHLPLQALPNLLLGRLPAEPVGKAEQGDGKVSYRDARGQTWNAQQQDEGGLLWWSLVQEGEAVAWWRRLEKESIFSDRRGGQQVRWRQQVSEALERPPAPLEVPEAYREGACGGVPPQPRVDP